MSNEYLESSRTLFAIAITAEKVAHKLSIEQNRKTAETLSVLATLGLEELDRKEKALDRMIENGSANRQAKRNQPIARGMGELNEY